MQIVKITKREADLFVVNKHYSRRASIFWAGFGLVMDGKIEGVVVYGQPSPPIQKHAFKDRDFKLYELSRLVIQTDKRNAASFLVGNSLKQLEKPCAVISYADTAHGHAGIVYQATNWIYTGATKSHDHTYLINGERVHPMTLRDKGISDPKRWAKENFVTTIPPQEKHRYFYFVGCPKEQKRMLKKMVYPVVSCYPKLPKQKYDAGPRIELKASGFDVPSLFDNIRKE
jgi:hypothetical protein